MVDETELVLKWKSLPRKDGDTNLLANSGTLVIEVNVLTVEMEVDVTRGACAGGFEEDCGKEDS